MDFYVLTICFCFLGALNSFADGRRRNLEMNQGIDPTELIVIEGNTYYISPPTIMISAHDATRYCDINGMKLISFHTEQKWMDIQDYLISNTTLGYNKFWSSLIKYGDNWRWINGNFANFYAWEDNTPNIETESGICVNFIASLGWIAEECKNINAAFICELDFSEY